VSEAQVRSLRVSEWLLITAGAVLGIGLALVAAYAFATTGPHVRYLGVGLLTAFAAFVSGCLFGFLFGVPRAVSSGEVRHKADTPKVVTQTQTDTTATTTTTIPPTTGTSTSTEGNVVAEETTGPAGSPGGAELSDVGAGHQFTQSSNLAEVSDWLTKLLLGAGLVELTHLGGPLGGLVDVVARGLETTTGSAPSDAARVVSGSLLVLYLVVGFLSGYVVTTLWYERRLREA
jgi:hypothetical protein